MGVEVTLQDALDNLGASNVKDRADGLTDLKHVLLHNKNKPNLDGLGDIWFTRIYEKLFEVVILEKSIYLKAKNAITQSAAESRLSNCASALRQAVDIGARVVNFKTVRALLDHIIETLPIPSGRLCTPIALDYGKALVAILRYQPHVEHLTLEEWERAAVFCVETIRNAQVGTTENEDIASGDESRSHFGITSGLSYRSSRSYFKESVGSQDARSLAKQVVEEMVSALCLMTAAPNAPIRDRAAALLWPVIEFLKGSSAAGRSQQAAFAAVNHILACTRTEDISLTAKATIHLLRLIGNFWTSKPSALKDEMLICLLYLRPFIDHGSVGRDGPIFRTEIGALLDIMRSEYSRRIERDQLRIEDLRLVPRPELGQQETASVDTPIFTLRCVGRRAEQNWTLVNMMAFLCKSLESDTYGSKFSGGDEEVHKTRTRPTKRLKRTSIVEDFLTFTSSGSQPTRACALQVLVFFAQKCKLAPRHLARFIDLTSSSCSDDNGTTASWAFLLLASCASQRSSRESSLAAQWSLVWQLASRGLSNVSTCRATSYVLSILIHLRLVAQSSINDLLQTVISAMDLSGPSILADSVLLLLRQMIKVSQQLGPSTTNAVAETSLSWLFQFFTPSKFEDKAYVSVCALFDVLDVVKLVEACLNHPSNAAGRAMLAVWESVAQAWLKCEHEQSLVAYLLLSTSDGDLHYENLILLDGIDRARITVPTARTTCEALVLNHLPGELQRMQDSLQQWLKERPEAVSLDMFQSICISCIVSCYVAHSHSFRDARRLAQLQKQTELILKTLCTFLQSSQCGQDKADVLLSISSQILGGFFTDKASSGHSRTPCEVWICRSISAALAARRSARHFNGLEEDDESVDFEDGYDTQDSREDAAKVGTLDLKSELAVAYSALAVRSKVALYVTMVAKQNENNRFGEGHQRVSSHMIDFISSLPDTSILSCHDTITSLPSLGLNFTADDAKQLLEYCADNIMSKYPFERSEVATNAVLNILSSCIPLWTERKNESLFDLGVDLYSWYTSVALDGRVLSPTVQRRLARLLLRLCQTDKDYPYDNDVPSVRTSLFKLVQHGCVAAQFHMADRISTIFGFCEISAHSALFDELQHSLPAEADWFEGMAMRLLFFAKLASAWHSLVRECVYYIFETAGRVNQTSQHAAYCISQLSSALRSKSPSGLFRLFAPQLLHSWFESQNLASLPFIAFEYSSLEELLRENHAEITAQLLMRRKEDDLQWLAIALKTNVKDLCRNAFAKCAAYAIGWDISQSSSDSSTATSETGLRSVIGNTEEYKSLLLKQFPTIVGYFYITMQQEDILDKWLEKKPAYKAAAQVMKQVQSFGFSTRILTAGQQPSFKSKYLGDQIERLCRRTGHDPVSPWNVSSLSLAVRMLLDNIDESLGPLHTCLTLRKLRVLICMSGQVSLAGYPLEVLLRSIRPYLSDSQCAEDAIGMLRYLLQNGQPYLDEHNLYLARGSIVLMILQIRKHSRSKQESTTQESQHKGTLQKMESFYSWLIEYLQDNREALPTGIMGMTDKLCHAIENVKLPGNAYKNSAESSLLLLLLDLQGVSNPIISPSDGLEALLLLTEHFDAPNLTTEDCLGDDVAAAKYAQCLSLVLGTARLSDSFLIWACGVIGRAFAATGHRQRFLSQNRSLLVDEGREGILKSQAIIAHQITNVVVSKNRYEAGIAEYTLRKVAGTFQAADEDLEFEQMLPVAIVPAVVEGCFGYQPSVRDMSVLKSPNRRSLERALELSPVSTDEEWTVSVCAALCSLSTHLPILSSLCTLLMTVEGLAIKLLAPIVHMVLADEVSKEPLIKSVISSALTAHLMENDPTLHRRQRILLGLLLYLRIQPYPGEATKADRLRWLDVDYVLAAEAATRCAMATAGLMFAESAITAIAANRRGPARPSTSQMSGGSVPSELLLAIFKQVDEPDSFYGVERSASLHSVLERLDYEQNGPKSLMFRSAQMDSNMRIANQATPPEPSGVIRSLSAMNLNSLTFALMSQASVNTAKSADIMLDAARQLEQWDVALPEASDQGARCFSVFQEMSRASSQTRMISSLQSALLEHVRSEYSIGPSGSRSRSWYSVLASLTEIAELVNVSNEEQLLSRWQSMQSRNLWMQFSPYEACQVIVSNRQTAFSVLSQNQLLLDAMHVHVEKCKVVEAESLLALSKFARDQGVLQEALSAATHCHVIAKQCKNMGTSVIAAAELETAKVLWAVGETNASVTILRELVQSSNTEDETIPVGRSGLLAQLAHQLAEARLESADEILVHYLEPAIESLHGRHHGEEAGDVFYEFAAFCDQQLQNTGNTEDFTRMAKLRQKRAKEIDELQTLLKSTKRVSQDKGSLEHSIRKAKQWFDIDNAEYERMKVSRDTFVQQSLQNYLLTLHASDSHDICALRLFALWLENENAEDANAIICKYLPWVPSWKFVVLLSQLMSRLEENASAFQVALKALARRICTDHPYHSLHHLYATTRRPSSKDGAATSRYNAAMDIRRGLTAEPKVGDLLQRLFKANGNYDFFARSEIPNTGSSKVTMQDFPSADKMAKAVINLGVPPITANLPLQADGKYSDVPILERFHNALMIMGGLSKPKTLTAVATDGKEYKQLFKGGHDDLRQDAIMEQVFEEVSKMLRQHKATRQRDLHVNTYKVIPLTTRSGVLEWVPNSIPIDRFLRSAHERYHPQDMKPDSARERIKNCEKLSIEIRVKEYQKICSRLQPVMRHFFFERFDQPDEWFEKRTAYTRTTASISMLGHVLGLGDRHCQNIVLDEKSGQVVHIDLGVAFEAGRVLPVPELVPFRLSRDIIDGMGITKTEGVFRRCCEFTMDALRDDKDTIMTLLNVLRYDPLYSWTLSPLRAKRVQDQETERMGELDEPASSKREQEAGEADRALSIVEKKLSKTLSTAATVNELIQQATDERNLARLFAGWSAYF